VKSFMAALRNLVLPFGQTSGQRIVLDGDNGRIDIYDSSNNLLLRLSPTGIEVFDQLAARRMLIASPGGTFSTIIFETGKAAETGDGLLSLADWNSGLQSRMVLTPSPYGKGSAELTFLSTPSDNSAAPLIQAVGLTIDSGAPAAIVDLTGASAPKAFRLVASDFELGTAPTFGSPPTILKSMPRGQIDWATSTSDVTLSTTAGTYTTILTGNAKALKSGRRYRITAAGGDNMLSGGSGFATSDTWMQKLQVDTGSGFGDLTLSGPSYVVRAFTALAHRYRIPNYIGYYVPGSNVTATFRWMAAKTAGASTVTTQYQANAGVSPFTLLVEDLGT
jgi:hypothetical protein